MLVPFGVSLCPKRLHENIFGSAAVSMLRSGTLRQFFSCLSYYILNFSPYGYQI